jgi:hypothetical protein
MAIRRSVDWTALTLWVDRLPWWQQIVVVPPLLIWMFVATLCRISPRGAAVFAVALIVASVLSVGSGLVAVSTYQALASIAFIYAYFNLLAFLAVVWVLLEPVRERWMGVGKAISRANGSSALWDREIDG